MLKVTTDCSKCIHKNVCKKVNNMEMMKNKLASMNFGKGPNDDYNWDTMSDSYGVDISFSCADFSQTIDYSHYGHGDYWSNR